MNKLAVLAAIAFGISSIAFAQGGAKPAPKPAMKMSSSHKGHMTSHKKSHHKAHKASHHAAHKTSHHMAHKHAVKHGSTMHAAPKPPTKKK